MDIETYHFEASAIPYTKARSRDACIRLMLSDIDKHGAFVLSAVTGDFGVEMMSMYRLAVQLNAPKALRMKRIEQRAHDLHGARIIAGGDMFAQHRDFVGFAAARSLAHIQRWAAVLACPILQADGKKDVLENARLIAAQYRETVKA